MAEYIDYYKNAGDHISTSGYVTTVTDLPPVVYAEQKRGKWIKDPGGCYSLYKCTACNDLCTAAGWANCVPEEQMYKAFKYCPNCGAKMERSEDACTD